MMLAVWCVVALLALVRSDDPTVSIEGVLDLTPDNFDSVIGKDKAALVEFYAPWCGHCKNMVPEIVRVGKAVKKSRGDVIMAKVNADTHRSLGGRYKVEGFPTLKYFAPGSTEAVDYDGGRDAESMVQFLNEKAGSNLKVPQDISKVKVLTDSNFDKIVKDATKDVLVEFYAPWCGHCKQLAPEYEKVATTFLNEPNVVIAKVDATAATSSKIAKQFDISGYPTIKFFPRGNKAGEEYSGGRSADDFVTFMNKAAGTQRILGGSYAPEVGTDKHLANLAIQFMDVTGDKMKAFKNQMAEYVESKDVPHGKVYLKIADKVVEKGVEYVNKEIKRVEGIIESGTITPKKIDSMTIRLNVLKTFVE